MYAIDIQANLGSEGNLWKTAKPDRSLTPWLHVLTHPHIKGVSNHPCHSRRSCSKHPWQNCWCPRLRVRVPQTCPAITSSLPAPSLSAYLPLKPPPPRTGTARDSRSGSTCAQRSTLTGRPRSDPTGTAVRDVPGASKWAAWEDSDFGRTLPVFMAPK